MESTSGPTDEVSRIVIVRDDGTAHEYWADSWRMVVQDGGRTLKAFAHGSGAKAAKQRAAELAEDLGRAPQTAALRNGPTP